MLTALKWILGVLSCLLAFLAPAQDALFAILVFIVVDLVVGIWASMKRGEKFISWKLRHTITRKIAPYFVAVLVAMHFEHHFLAGTWLEGIPLMKSISTFVALSELKSIFERLGEITGLDFWAFFKERLQPFVKPTTPLKDQD